MKSAFDQAGIEMPEPIYRIHMAEQWPNSNTSVEAASVVAAAEATAPAQKPEKTAKSVADHAIDVSTDETIPEQVAADLANSDEENLLTK